VLWFAIFVAAALFLLGVIRLQGEANDGVGPKRFVAGLATLLFAFYCGYGALGHRMDRIMTAIIPPYSNLAGGGAEGRAGAREAKHIIVVDDYEAARRLAIEQGKGLLVNFTGHTCVNCRMMELGVFPRPEVAAELENYVEARLHTDGTTNIDEIRRLQQEMTQSVANPFYVIQNPSTEEIIDRHEGATLGSPQIFIDFLRRNATRARDFQTATAK
jgi:thiol:disulfide interchange protein DsbD